MLPPHLELVFARRAPQDAGGIQHAPAERPQIVFVLLGAAIYVYLLQRTYPPGS